LPAWSLVLIAVSGVGFAGWAVGDEFPTPYNSEPDRTAAPLPAAEAAASMQVPDGFHVQVFASEPDVQNPIAMTWDARGRLWIAENYTYAERAQQFDLSLRDRVLILEDADGDGTADRRTVFTDQVQMLTSVEVGHGGVWLMCPPRLLFVPDADRDDAPDGPARTMLDGFEVARENYHNFANGLRWGPDGWLYGRCGGSCPGRIGVPGTPAEQRVALEGGIWRYQPRTRQFEVLTHGTTNPWGNDWNEYGHGFFINTVNGHLWHLIPGAHLQRPFTLDPNPHVYQLLDMHADHWHFDTGAGWQKSRDGAANALGGGHAHCGLMIYLGDSWPEEYRGRLLTWNFHGRRANQELLERCGSGYVGRHGRDLLLSTDSFFRGMDLRYGPEGAVYAIDWSDTGECHEHTGVHRTSGRVYRIAYQGATGPASTPEVRSPDIDLRSQTARQLATLMSHRNAWYPRQARLILAERCQRRGVDVAGDDLTAAIEQLRRTVWAADPSAAYRALTTLHAMHVLDHELLRQCLSHPSEHLRFWAVRLLTDAWPLDDVFGPPHVSAEQAAAVEVGCRELLPDLLSLAKHDPSGLVRLAVASTLPRLPVTLRPVLARQIVERAEDADDHNLPLLVWYGLIPVAQADPLALVRVARAARWPLTQRLIARALAEQIEESPFAVDRLLAHVSETGDLAERKNVLRGIADGLQGWSQAPEPAAWRGVVAATAATTDKSLLALVRQLSVVFGDGRALEQVRALVLDDQGDIGVRRSALQTFVTRGGDGVTEVCLALLRDPRLNALAAQGLARSSVPGVAEALVQNYQRFRAPQRPRVIEILVSRRSFAAVLLDAIATGQIPSGDLKAFDVRQIRSLGDDALQRRVAALWGDVRESSAAKRKQIASIQEHLTPDRLAQADVSQGRALFNQTCRQCHRLFGQGESVGPDLTGAQRQNLDYLLENIVDPSAVVSKDFRMSVVVTTDGRVLNGLVVSQNAKMIRLQTQTDQQVIPRHEIEETLQTKLSPMPDGLLDNLGPGQVRDLFAYLMVPAQVPLPEDVSTE
jgi:putative membrane-bound dehydrogenase-like protein